MAGSLPDADEGWAYEVKWDGVRALGFIEDGGLRLQSSNGLDITARYPELAAIAGQVGDRSAILDGEIVTFNADGRPDFGLLQDRMHANDPATIARWAATRPVVWILFDLLHLDGHDLYVANGPGLTPGGNTALAYTQRRALLEALIDPGPNWQVPRPQLGGGADLLAAVTERGMEGLVAKRVTSLYEVGKRSHSWRKVKVRRRQELVVGGWKQGEGARAGTIGALLVGHYGTTGQFLFAGRVGSGLGDAALRRLHDRFAGLGCESCPFDSAPPADETKGAHWVEPEVVVEVAFGEWSRDGRLRHPSFVGIRDDKNPRDVVREPT